MGLETRGLGVGHRGWPGFWGLDLQVPPGAFAHRLRRCPAGMTPESAERFDRFRRYPPEVAAAIAQAILKALPSGKDPPTLLEIGAGTGVMALPLLGLGCRYLGLDQDPEMLRRFREKAEGLGNWELLLADARSIPLPEGSVDGVLLVRFWHLVAEWERVLAEALRVLRPGGVLLEGFERIVSPEEEALFRAWESALGQEGIGVERGLHGRRLQEVGEALRALGLAPEVREVVAWREERPLRELLELLEHRVFHFAQGVPEAAHRWAVAAVRAWAEARFGGPEASSPPRSASSCG